MAHLAKTTNPGSLCLFICIFCLEALLPCKLEGQNNEIRNIISSNFPVNNQNWEIYQDPVNRYLYFANTEGLVEYNGISS